MAVPSPQEQIEFLQKAQRLLSEGLFVASYKFALMRALADLAVLKGDDTGTELELGVSEIANVFIELYWRQTRPFCASGDPKGKVLRQNTGQQAAIIQTIVSVQTEYQGSLPRLRRDSIRWNGLVRDVAKTVAAMPLWKLQRMGNEVVDFLYPNTEKGRVICLKPGVAYCLRNFYGILRNLIEGAWVNYIRNLNLQILGHSTDLGSFLFGAERGVLDVYRPILVEIQKNTCFYCHQSIRNRGEVDHFIPWSKYPVDQGHNFVLAHEKCNAKKSDFLAAEEHLGAWIERNNLHSRSMKQFFDQVRVADALESAVSIARWAYSQTASANGLVWVKDDVFRHLGSEWMIMLAVA
jgi:hypothetical protein